MDILIKSFNRPYYLDRCLSSIEKFVDGFEKITVMDDGTPQKYLDLISKKYPFIKIVYSEDYHTKSEIIESENGQVLPEKIPTKLWNEQAKLATNYFIMLEDDMWFTQKVNLKSIDKDLFENDVYMLKLFWLGNSKLVDYQSKKEIKNLEICQPYPSLFKSNYFYWVYYRLQKLNKIKSFLGLYDKEEFLKYYTIYGVAGMIFKKDYYLALWDDKQSYVNERQQLLNGLKFLKTKSNFSIAKTKDEVLKTGFISAASNSNKTHYKNHVPMDLLNHFLNEKWFLNQFDTLENFPLDFSKDYIFKLLSEDSNDFAENWLNWHEEFKNQYLKLGCQL